MGPLAFTLHVKTFSQGAEGRQTSCADQWTGEVLGELAGKTALSCRLRFVFEQCTGGTSSSKPKKSCFSSRRGGHKELLCLVLLLSLQRTCPPGGVSEGAGL